MKILGIDPGIGRVGWALVHTTHNIPETTAYGCIETTKQYSTAQRLLIIYDTLSDIIKEHTPDCVAVEELYFATNAKTAIIVGQARGVILFTAAQNQISIASYSPLAIKKTICGSGKADKKQVERMVLSILNLKTPITPDDTADALAIALTHAFSYKMKSLTV